MPETLLEVVNLTKHFPVTQGTIFPKKVGSVKAVDGINFNIAKGETFGLVGESGCGKTTTARLILMLEKASSGNILLNGHDILNFNKVEMKQYRSQVQAVFQDPYSSLSPRMRVGKIIAEPIVVNNNLNRSEIRQRVVSALEVVGLDGDQKKYYPHEFSGGQRQRIAIARALACNPQLIILDEPVSALDVSIGAQIMNLLKNIQKKIGLSYLVIAHDLAIVKHMSHRIGVMYLGKLVETADSGEIYRNPLHPYTQALYSAALPSHPDDQNKEIILHGEMPSPLNPPSGCYFHSRCTKVQQGCIDNEPELVDVGDNHWIACHFPNAI